MCCMRARPLSDFADRNSELGACYGARAAFLRLLHRAEVRARVCQSACRARSCCSAAAPRRAAVAPAAMDEAMLNDIISRLLEVRHSRVGKPVALTENEIRALCVTARDIFMSQPCLLELEAPIKICGAWGEGGAVGGAKEAYVWVGGPGARRTLSRPACRPPCMRGARCACGGGCALCADAPWDAHSK